GRRRVLLHRIGELPGPRPRLVLLRGCDGGVDLLAFLESLERVAAGLARLRRPLGGDIRLRDDARLEDRLVALGVSRRRPGERQGRGNGDGEDQQSLALGKHRGTIPSGPAQNRSGPEGATGEPIRTSTTGGVGRARRRRRADGPEWRDPRIPHVVVDGVISTNVHRPFTGRALIVER